MYIGSSSNIKRETGVELRSSVSRPSLSLPAPPPPPQSEAAAAAVLSQQHLPGEPVHWNWMTVDAELFPDISIPVIERPGCDEQDALVVSVRIIERTVLARFENQLSPEAIAYGRLACFECTRAECDELNQINELHVDGCYGPEKFNVEDDKLVRWQNFKEFFDILKRTCRLKSIASAQSIGLSQPVTPVRCAYAQAPLLTTISGVGRNVPSAQAMSTRNPPNAHRYLCHTLPFLSL